MCSCTSSQNTLIANISVVKIFICFSWLMSHLTIKHLKIREMIIHNRAHGFSSANKRYYRLHWMITFALELYQWSIICKVLIRLVLMSGSKTWIITNKIRHFSEVLKGRYLDKFKGICIDGEWRRTYNFELY